MSEYVFNDMLTDKKVLKQPSQIKSVKNLNKLGQRVLPPLFKISHEMFFNEKKVLIR